MTETVDVFYQETNYVTLLIFWLLIDVCFLLLHVSFIFDCLVYFLYFFHYSVLRIRFYNKINCVWLGVGHFHWTAMIIWHTFILHCRWLFSDKFVLIVVIVSGMQLKIA